MITTNDGYVQFNFTPTLTEARISINAPGKYYLEDVAVFKTVSETKYTPTTHEKVLPTFTNAMNINQYGATLQSAASGWPKGGHSVQQVNKGDYIQFEIGSDALTNYYRVILGISYTPSGRDFGMDFNWYISGSTGEYQIYTAGVYRTRYLTPYGIQNGNKYKIWRNNGNVEFYINDVLNRSFQDMYPDRPMYLEAAFHDPNRKVENLYIYKEVVKTSNVVETTHLVAKGDYRYGFQNQERDDEIKGRGNSYNYTYRMHDSRLGIFFAVDPLVWKYPFYSSYQFSSNSPIFTVELEGLESSYLINYSEKNSITLTKNENNQFEIDMTEANKLDQQYRENIQGANFSRPHDATPAPGTRIQAISSGSKDVHAWTIIIPANATVTTDEDIQTMNQQQNLAKQNTRITPSKPDKTQTAQNNVPSVGQVNIGNNPVPPGGNLWVNINAQFAPNTTNITNNNEINRVINNVAGALLANPNNSITIYASSKLPTGANWNTTNTAVGMTFGQLADQRNQVIADKLIELGVNPNQINMKRGRSDAMRVNGNFRNNAPAETPSSP